MSRPDTPLGDLVAGRIDQAEYRRRMGELEARSWDALGPEPVRRQHTGSCRHWVLWATLGTAWFVGVIAIAWLVAWLVTPGGAP